MTIFIYTHGFRHPTDVFGPGFRASAPAFEAVLRFIYSAGQAGQLFEEADPLEVLHLSVEFMLEDLTRLCEWKLMQGLTLDRLLKA